MEDSSHSKIIGFIKNINQNEIEILDDVYNLEEIIRKKYLDSKLLNPDGNKSIFIALDEAELRLNDIISKYESRP